MSLKHLTELTEQIKELQEQIDYLEFKKHKLLREYQTEVKEIIKDDFLFANLKPE